MTFTKYHRGYLARDRKDNPKLHKMARQVYEDAQDGKVTLVQQRLGPNDYVYLKRTRC